MKKLLVLFLMTMFMSGIVMIGKVQAGSLFDLNLNTLNSGWGYYDDIYSITVEGFGDVDQSFGGDTFNDGDTFTEYSVFQKVSYKQSLAGSSQYFTGLMADNKIFFAYAPVLSGYAVNVTANTFDYIFDAGSLISLYIGDNIGDLSSIDAAYLATAVKVADLALTAGSGAGKDGFFTGSVNTGTTRITAAFDNDSTPQNVWSVDGLGDLTELSYPAYLTLDTTNSNPDGVDFYGYTDVNGNFVAEGFKAFINSSGKVEAAVVPEPSTVLLLGLGLLGLGSLGRKKLLN